MGAFLDGGMTFSHENQTLKFPKCGYYYISSQVLFLYSAIDNQNNNNKNNSHHVMEITPNCPPYKMEKISRFSFSSLIGRQNVKTSTYISDVVKICEGGSVRVIVPTYRNLCCASGDSHSTHISAFLISEFNCD